MLKNAYALCIFWFAVSVPAPSMSAGALPAQNQDPQIVSHHGALPRQGRLIIRSGLAWMDETSPLFAFLAHNLSQALTEKGFSIIATSPSRRENLPLGTEEVRNAHMPALPGGGRGRQRIMSMPEAIVRMHAMQLSREGRLPRLPAVKAPAALHPVQAAPDEKGLPLTKPELIRFALTQETGQPALHGQADIPGRLPHELWETDADKAEYALVVKFAMLWPAAEQKARSAIVAGWHLLLLDCYDLSTAKSGKNPRLVWNATVQRVVFSPNLSLTLQDMARAALL